MTTHDTPEAALVAAIWTVTERPEGFPMDDAEAAAAILAELPDMMLVRRDAWEAMQGDAADLTDLIGEAAAMRTVLRHLIGDDRGRIHDNGCEVCDAGRALMTAEHELPSLAPTLDVCPDCGDRNHDTYVCSMDECGCNRR